MLEVLWGRQREGRRGSCSVTFRGARWVEKILEVLCGESLRLSVFSKSSSVPVSQGGKNSRVAKGLNSGPAVPSSEIGSATL